MVLRYSRTVTCVYIVSFKVIYITIAVIVNLIVGYFFGVGKNVVSNILMVDINTVIKNSYNDFFFIKRDASCSNIPNLGDFSKFERPLLSVKYIVGFLAIAQKLVVGQQPATFVFMDQCFEIFNFIFRNLAGKYAQFFG